MMKDTDDITEESKILAKIFTEKLAKERSLAYPPGNLFFICKAVYFLHKIFKKFFKNDFWDFLNYFS